MKTQKMISPLILLGVTALASMPLLGFCVPPKLEKEIKQNLMVDEKEMKEKPPLPSSLFPPPSLALEPNADAVQQAAVYEPKPEMVQKLVDMAKDVPRVDSLLSVQETFPSPEEQLRKACLTSENERKVAGPQTQQKWAIVKAEVRRIGRQKRERMSTKRQEHERSAKARREAKEHEGEILHCDQRKWEKTGTLVGLGGFGTVVGVVPRSWQEIISNMVPFGGKVNKEPEDFVLKHATTPDDRREIKTEVDVMEDLKKKTDCDDYLLLHEDVCHWGRAVRGGLSEIGYVSRKMKGDLFYLRDWKVSKQCLHSVYEHLKDALICLHGAGYMHGDLKSDNVYYEDTDPKGCPTGLKLADFGWTRELGSEQSKNKSDPSVNHLPLALFKDTPETPLHKQLAVRGKTGELVLNKFKADAVVDHCSLAFMMLNSGLGLTTCQLLPPGIDCGRMGNFWIKFGDHCERCDLST